LTKELEILVTNANQSGEPIKHYIGFEISGLVHIGTGISSALKIKKLTDAGVYCTIWLADYHTYLNGKLDGQFSTIRFVAREYFGPVMLECLRTVGCDMDLVQVLYAEDEYKKLSNNALFWEYDIVCGKQLTLSRVMKSVSIMGKEAGNSVDFGTLRYPVMQVADAFFLGTHLVHAGIDQRKSHVLMREIALSLEKHYALKINNLPIKPIAIHHDLLLSLEPPKEGEDSVGAKMSKSKPNSAVWVHDSEDEIFRKLKKAYCPMPEGLSDEQLSRIPLLQWSRFMIYPAGHVVSLNRKDEHGGDTTYSTYEALFRAYKSGSIHPLDLKAGVATTLAKWFLPIRDWVSINPAGMQKILDVKANI
jgi:tyrosyl-tRNA synthetase